MPLSYDRRVPEALLSALEPGGWAHSLVEYGSSGMWGLDLQLRGLSPKAGRWASLYVGTTKVLDLHVSAKDQFKLFADAGYTAKHGLAPAWSTYRSVTACATDWPEVGTYLDAVIEAVVSDGKHLKEGMVQSAISRFPGKLTMIDREVVVSYSNDREKARWQQVVSTPLLLAAERADAPKWWNGSRPTGVSDECDLLALNRRGQLLAIEVKPSTAPASKVAWAPVQARQYANYLQAWVETTPSAPDVIQELMEQKVRIGTRAKRIFPRLNPALPVKPVVAIDSRVGTTALQRLAEVQEHYKVVGMPLNAEIRLVNLIGRMTVIDESLVAAGPGSSSRMRG